MKDYQKWHAKKAQLQQKAQQPYFYEREVWWASIGLNVGDEEDGKGQNFARPVLVLRKFNKYLFYGVPLTSRMKVGKYYYPVNIAERKNTVLLSQLRSYDSARLLSKFGSVSDKDFRKIKKVIVTIIAP